MIRGYMQFYRGEKVERNFIFSSTKTFLLNCDNLLFIYWKHFLKYMLWISLKEISFPIFQNCKRSKKITSSCTFVHEGVYLWNLPSEFSQMPELQKALIGFRVMSSQLDLYPCFLRFTYSISFLTIYLVHHRSMLKALISKHKEKLRDDICLTYCLVPLSMSSKHGLQMRETGKTGASSSCVNFNLPKRPLISPVSENSVGVRWWVILS